jgi:hypothetical protein
VPGPQFLLKTLLNSAASSWLFAAFSLLWITEQYFVLSVLVLGIGPIVSTQEASVTLAGARRKRGKIKLNVIMLYAAEVD